LSERGWPGSILVAIDGSASSQRGLAQSIALARAVGARLLIVTAIPRLSGYRGAYFSFVDRHALEEMHKLAESLLQEALQEATAAGLEDLETAMLEGTGDVFEQIADRLQQKGPIDLVVLGSFGHSVGDRLILGSTTQRLILEVARRGFRTSILVVP
jgi:nucleotide-binding universal stress UspA family protein